MGFATPKGPYLVSRFVDTKRFTNSVNIELVGNLAYIPSSGRLNIIDVSKPSLPVVIASLTHANFGGIGGVRVFGSYAFCGCETRASMAVVDISNPYQPFYVTEIRGPVAGTSLAGASNIRLNAAGTIAFVTTITPRHSLAMINISDPINPVWIADIQGPTPGTSLNNIRDVLLSADEKTAYCTGDSSVFSVAMVDVTTPSAPAYIKNIGSGYLAGSRGRCFSPDGKLLWVAGGSLTQSGSGAWAGGIQCWDVSANQNDPQFVSFFPGTSGSGSKISYLSGARTLIAKDNYLYQVSESGRALVVFNVTDPRRVFIEAGSLGPQPGTTLNGAMNMAMKNGYAFIPLFQGNGFAVMSLGGYPTP